MKTRKLELGLTTPDHKGLTRVIIRAPGGEVDIVLCVLGRDRRQDLELLEQLIKTGRLKRNDAA